jgi:hypothetical protein
MRRDEAPALLRKWEIEYGMLWQRIPTPLINRLLTLGYLSWTNRTRAQFGISGFAYEESLLVPAGYAMAHKGKAIHAIQIQES